MRYDTHDAPPFAPEYRARAGRNILLGIERALCQRNGTNFAVDLAQRSWEDYCAARICAALSDLIAFTQDETSVL
jgi:hypothetical protein